MSILFVSLDEEWVDAMKPFSTKYNIQLVLEDIREITSDLPIIYVSPANSYGVMDGGIDLILSRDVFPGIEPVVKKRITQLDRGYLPIGEAIYIPYLPKENRGLSRPAGFHFDTNKSLIVAPTMFIPTDVSDTRNAYLSACAAFSLWKDIMKQEQKEYCLVMTSHCCGVGRMDPSESARQMIEAYEEIIIPFNILAAPAAIITPLHPNPYYS